MGRLRFRLTRRVAALLAGLALAPLTAAPLTPADAQSVGDFRLQPGATPQPPVTGPVDPDHPSRPALPQAPASTAPNPAPSSIAPVIEVPTPTPSGQGTAADARAGRPALPETGARRAGAVPTGAPLPRPTPTASASAPETPAVMPAPMPPSLASAAPAEAIAPRLPAGGIAWWWLIPAVLAGAGATLFALRGRRKHPEAPEIVRPVTMAPAAPDPVPQPAAEPIAPVPLEIALEPVRMSLSLVNATLQYRVKVSNRTDGSLGPLSLGADMIAAHASLPAADQLASEAALLPLRHEIAALAPGESAEVKGELRLPLASVTPIRNGSAALFVPLVRLRVSGAGDEFTQTLVIGEQPSVSGGPLRAFRLDQGPRIFGAVGQRALASAA